MRKSTRGGGEIQPPGLLKVSPFFQRTLNFEGCNCFFLRIFFFMIHYIYVSLFPPLPPPTTTWTLSLICSRFWAAASTTKWTLSLICSRCWAAASTTMWTSSLICSRCWAAASTTWTLSLNMFYVLGRCVTNNVDFISNMF